MVTWHNCRTEEVTECAPASNPTVRGTFTRMAVTQISNGWRALTEGVGVRITHRLRQKK